MRGVKACTSGWICRPEFCLDQEQVLKGEKVGMSRSKQETLLLEERIEKIRKKNEEIKKRHLEVEADKQNAAKLNALVQINSPSEDWPIGGRSSPPSHPPAAATSRRPRRSDANRYQINNTSINNSNINGGNNGNVAKCYTFSEGNGPPPDPKYKFLADAERDSERRHSRPHRGRGNARGTPNWDRHPRGGAGDAEPVHPEYEAWRAERNRIDNDRINRQKTAEGHWRREWDNEKITQEEEVRPANRGMRGMGPYRGSNRNSNHEFNQDYNTAKENSGHSSSRERGRGFGPRGRGNMRGRRQVQMPISELSSNSEESAASPNQRSILNVRESIKISIPNETATPSMRRVKVNPPIVGGSGRVGPRQKIFVNYSSQSEDEAPYQRHVEIQPNRVVTISSDSTSPNPTASSPVSKPPLPPSTGQKADPPKPRRQRVKSLEQDPRIRKQAERERDDGSDTTEERSVERRTESGGDDSWEDVTTTSGTESACEEMSPRDDVAKLNEINLTMNENDSAVITEPVVADETAEEEVGYEVSSENVAADDISEVNKSEVAISDSSADLTTLDETVSVSVLQDHESLIVNNSRCSERESENLTADSNKTENVVADNDFESNSSIVADSYPEDNLAAEVNKSAITVVEINAELTESDDLADKDPELKIENPTESLDDVAADNKCEEQMPGDSVADSSLEQNQSECSLADSNVLPEDSSKAKELDSVLVTNESDSVGGSETMKSEGVPDRRSE